jgi:hypothetical protein
MAKTTVQLPDIEAELAQADPALGRVIAAVIARIGRQRIRPRARRRSRLWHAR